MTRKNTLRPEVNNVFFDQKTKAVMANVTQDGIKEKITQVREVIPTTHSNNEIILVLQQYENDVERTIQAFLDGSAKEALQEWHYPGNKPGTKKKKKSKGKKSSVPATETSLPPDGSTQTGPTEAAAVPEPSQAEEPTASRTAAPTHLINGHISSSSGSDGTSPNTKQAIHKPSVPDTSSTSAPPKDHAAPPAGRQQRHTQQPVRPKSIDGHGKRGKVGSSGRQRTISEVSNCSSISTSDKSRGPHSGLEKSFKDLQRQTTSLQRQKLLLREEVEKAFKNIKRVCESMHKLLNDREADLIYEMDKVKGQAYDTLKARQDLAVELKQKSDRAPNMTEKERAELRSEIKHFVTDRKIDEELGRTTRFLYDSDSLMEQIKNFGEIVPVRTTYNQRHPSVSSLASSVVSHDDLQSPLTPSVTQTSFPSSPTAPVFASNAPKPLMSMNLQSETMTAQELAELKQRLEDSLKMQGIPTNSPAVKRNLVVPKPVIPGQAEGGKPATSKPGSAAAAEELKKSRNARRRQKQRERQREQRSNGDAVQDSSQQAEGQDDSKVRDATGGKSTAKSPSKPNLDSNESRSNQSEKMSPSPRRGTGRRTGSARRVQGQEGQTSRSPRRPRPGQVPGKQNSEGKEGKPEPKAGSNTSVEKGKPVGEKGKSQKELDNKAKSLKQPAQVNTVNGPVTSKHDDVKKPAEKSGGERVTGSTDSNDNKVEIPKNGPKVAPAEKPKNEVTISVKDTMKDSVTVSVSKIDEFQDAARSLPQRKPRDRGGRRNEGRGGGSTQPVMNGDVHSGVNGINHN